MIIVFIILIVGCGVQGTLWPMDDILPNDNTTSSLTTMKNILPEDNTTASSTAIESILLDNNTTSSSTTIKSIVPDNNSTLSSTTIKNILADNNSTLSSTTVDSILFDDDTISSSTTMKSILLDDNTTSSSTTIKNILPDNNSTLSSTIIENISIDDNNTSLSITIKNHLSDDYSISSSTTIENILPDDNVTSLSTTMINIVPAYNTTLSSTAVKNILPDDNLTLSSTTIRTILSDDNTKSPSTTIGNNILSDNTTLPLITLKNILFDSFKSLNLNWFGINDFKINTINILLNNMTPLPSTTTNDISLVDHTTSSSTTMKNILPDNNSVSSSVVSPQNNFVKNYNVYWNVPTFLCHRYGLNFKEVSKKFGMIQNFNDTYRGKDVAILYDPGMFPALFKEPNGSFIIRNGGVPQKGDLLKHLDAFKISVDQQIDQNFSGVGIIDFERWRPVFRQNWASLDHYRTYSYEIEKQEYSYLHQNVTKRLASKKFELFAQLFMEETIKMARSLRPNAFWSYYGYPLCFNLTPKQKNTQCDKLLIKDNDNIQWLWNQESVLLPTIYLPIDFDSEKKVGLINGRLNEARRIAKIFNPRPKILPYFWYKYNNHRDTFLNYDDLENAFREMINQNVDGFILWGSSKDFNSKEKCLRFHNYLNQLFGPLVKNMINSEGVMTNEVF